MSPTSPSPEAARARIWSFLVGLAGAASSVGGAARSEEHTSELQSRLHLVCRLLLEKKKNHDRETILQYPLHPLIVHRYHTIHSTPTISHVPAFSIRPSTSPPWRPRSHTLDPRSKSA